MIRFIPQNRHFLVDKGQLADADEIEDSMVLLPAGYMPPKEDYMVVVLVASASDCTFKPAVGASLVVEGHMVRDISIDGETYSIVQENYVLGRFGEDWE